MCFLLLQFISCLNFLEDGVGSREKRLFVLLVVVEEEGKELEEDVSEKG